MIFPVFSMIENRFFIIPLSHCPINQDSESLLGDKRFLKFLEIEMQHEIWD